MGWRDSHTKENQENAPGVGQLKLHIFYDLSEESTKLKRDIKDGKIVLGGCCMIDDDLKWECVGCGSNECK